MATHNPSQMISRIAYGDYSASQYKLLVQDTTTDTYVVTATTTTTAFLGVLQNEPETAEAATVICQGISKVILGARSTTGNPMTSDSAGRAVPTTQANNYVIGYCVKGGVTNDIGSVYVSVNQLNA